MHLQGAHPVLPGRTRRLGGGLLSRKRRSLARPLEAHRSRTAIGQEITFEIGDADDRVVEGSQDVGDPRRDVYFLPLFACLLLTGFLRLLYHFPPSCTD